MLQFKYRVMENKKIFQLLIFLISFAIGIVLGLSCFALEIAWPTSPMGTTLSDSSSLVDMVRYFYEWAIAIGGIATFIALLFGGFLYLTSAGDPGKLREAKDRIISAFVGLAILLGSWLILNTLNPELVVLKTPEATVPTIATGTIPLATSTLPSCSSAVVYSNTGCSGNSVTINTGSQTGNLISTLGGQPRSICLTCPVSGCVCVVKLYSSSDCSGDMLFSISQDQSDLNNLGLSAPVDCVKVETISY